MSSTAETISWLFEVVDKASAPAKAMDAALGKVEARLLRQSGAIQSASGGWMKLSQSVAASAAKQAKAADKARKSMTFEGELHKTEKAIAKIKANPLQFKQLQTAKKELRELNGGAKSFAERFEELGQSVKRVGLVQNLMLGAEAFKVGYELGEKLVDVVADIGKEMIAAAGGAERFKISFNALLGNEGAEDVLGYIEKIEKHTELSGAELKGLSADFLAVGFSAKELGQVLPAALDIGAFRGGGLANIQAAAAALDHIKTTGEVSKRSLGALGLEWTKVMTELRKETGLSDEAIKKKMEGGKFGERTLHAVLQVTADKQGGALGKTGEAMADGVTAKWKKIQELPEKVFEKWAETPGFAKFSKALTKILDKLDPDGPNGKKIFAALDRASMTVVSIVDKFADGGGIDKFAGAVTFIFDHFEGILVTVGAISGVLATIGGILTFGAMAASIKLLLPLLPALGTAFTGMLGTAVALAAPLAAVAAAAFSIGIAIARIVNTVEQLGGLKWVWRDFSTWARGEGPAVAGIHGVNDNSPQWKKDRAAGAGAPAIPSQSNLVAQGGGMRGGMSVDRMHTEVHVHVDGEADADQIASTVGTAMPGAMQQSMERLAISSGAM